MNKLEIKISLSILSKRMEELTLKYNLVLFRKRKEAKIGNYQQMILNLKSIKFTQKIQKTELLKLQSREVVRLF